MESDYLKIDEKVILIRINKRYRHGMLGEELYHNTRGVWYVKKERCRDASYAMAIYGGEIKEVYKIISWYKAKTTEYKYREDLSNRFVPNRLEFVGEVARDNIRNKYVGKSVVHYFNKGNQNPIFYMNC